MQWYAGHSMYREVYVTTGQSVAEAYDDRGGAQKTVQGTSLGSRV